MATSKRKFEKMAELVGDAHDHSFSSIESKMTVMASALLHLAKGTRYEADARDIVEGCCPEYFKTTIH